MPQVAITDKIQIKSTILWQFCLSVHAEKFLATVLLARSSSQVSYIWISDRSTINMIRKCCDARCCYFFSIVISLLVAQMPARSFLMRILSRTPIVIQWWIANMFSCCQNMQTQAEAIGAAKVNAQWGARRRERTILCCSFLDFNDIPSVLVTLQWIVTNEIRMKK